MKTIAQLRKGKKLTQAQLAQKADVSVGWIRTIEQGGGRGVSQEVQRKIAKALGEFPSDFLEHAGAYRADELWSEPNPMIAEPLRIFVLELEKQARKKGHSDQIAQIQGWRKHDTWILFQEMIFAAKNFGVKLPKV